MSKITDGVIKKWLKKNGQRQTLYRFSSMSIATRAKVRARVKAAILEEAKEPK